MDPKTSLVEAISRPLELVSLGAEDWDTLLPLLSQHGLLGRLYRTYLAVGALESIPEPVRRQLERGNAIAEAHQRMIRWEVNRIQRALEAVGGKFMLLKGAAYLLSGFPWAFARLTSDVDIMVDFSQLPAVEASLQAAGWRGAESDKYDDAYYREWMHELPPMQHTLRGSVIDVHHTILPRTSRLRPNPQLLWDSARALDPSGQMSVLSESDMLLHSAAHGFHHGELTNAFRDLVDIHDLATQFANSSPGFWTKLPARAFELDLARPLWYALRYASRLIGTQVPDTVFSALDPAAPPLLIRVVMDRLVQNVFLASEPASLSTRITRTTLLARAHYLRMPLRLLLPHLARKSWRRVRVKPAPA